MVCARPPKEALMKAPIAVGLIVALASALAPACVTAQPASGYSQNPSPPGLPEFSPLETRLLGQKRWVRGAPAGLRLSVTDHRNGKPLPARIEVTATPSDKSTLVTRKQHLFTGRQGRY